MKLYYDPASTVCRPITLFLQDHNLDIDLVHVDLTIGEHRADWYAEVNPNRQVPALTDGDFRILESATILRYLAALVDSPAYPEDVRARAKVDEALDWFNTGFYRDHGYGIVYPQILPNYRVHEAQTGALLAWHHERAAQRLQVLNDHMIGEGLWVAGTFSIADYFGASLVTIGEMVDFDLTPWPNVRRWLTAMEARPGWTTANAAFYGWRSAVRATAAKAA
jgi:glutathione S-transferase